MPKWIGSARYTVQLEQRDVFIEWKSSTRFRVFDRIGNAKIGPDVTDEYLHLPCEMVRAVCESAEPTLEVSY